MKPTILFVLIGILALISVNYVFTFFAFSKAIEFVILFLVVYSFGNAIVPNVRRFLLLPDTFWGNLLIHAIINIIVFMLANSFLSGITIIPTVIKSSSLGFITIQQINLDVIGTIVCGATLVAAVYELVFYLKS